MTGVRHRTVLLQFDRALNELPSGKQLSGGMSCAAAVGTALFLAHDETLAIERLRAERTGARSFRYARHKRFDLRKYLALPASAADSGDARPPEADVEGIAFCDGYLWIAGSHSALRDGANGRTAGEAIKSLSKVRRAGNRFLLARVPVAVHGDDLELVRHASRHDGSQLHAARLSGDRKDDALTRALRDDPHLGPFLSIPSKDNGFDVEGIAAAPGGRLFLGLRGPVIDGWACIVEVHVASHPKRDDELVLGKMRREPTADAQAKYRKHFLDLAGAGIRDLCWLGRDLLILTGPPMRGKGKSQVRQWKNALSANGERLVEANHLPLLLEIPYREKKDHAEGVAVLGFDARHVSLMVIYDSAGKDKRATPAGTKATLHRLAR